ncbi:hypothetical protein ACIQTT_10530 [Microbacterium sp. NPDC090225]|uniref:hypothetical protein n=1 Tax=Microbacterium sp. NPDC090225 TaxID=3364207 RepID=UPI00380B8D49
MSTRSRQYARILAATRERVESGGGIPALTLREVAATAELPLGSVRHVYPSKDALLEALAEDVIDVAREHQRRAMSEKNVLDRVVMLLPQDEQERQQARLEVRMGLHVADATLSEPARRAFAAASIESARLLQATCEQVIEIVAREPAGFGNRIDQVGLYGLVEGLRLQMLRGTVTLPEVFGAIRWHLQMLARKR